MGTLATDLRSEREKRNISLAQIAAETRISLFYLQYIEEGRYEMLPGGVYNRAFLRAYCDSLHLDQHEILRRYEAELSLSSERPSKPKKALSSHTALPKLHPIIVWAAMLILSATGLFLSRKWIASVFSPYFAPAPASNIRYEPSQRLRAQAASMEQGIAAAESTTPLRLEVEVTEKCWISINSDDQPPVEKLLEPGEAPAFGASEKFTLIIGNAGGIRLKINGRLAKPLDKSGDVVRILINDKNLQEFIDQTSG